MTTRLEYALALARQGFKIFPLSPGSKIPYAKVKWKEVYSSDEATICEWFRTKADMNYAVVCDDHHVILDPDEGIRKDGTKKHGIANFKQAEEDALGFVDESIYDLTFRVVTPKGGRHLYFKADKAYANSVGTNAVDDKEARGIIPDVDVRGPDGYVVGPGCWTYEDLPAQAEGDYLVENSAEIADLPTWLKDKLDAGGVTEEKAENAGTAAIELDLPGNIAAARGVLMHCEPAIEGHGGDLHTLKTAALLKDYGISEEVCLDMLYGCALFPPTEDHPEGCSWNETCAPPWEYEDLQAKVRNAYKYGNKQIGAKGDALSAIAEAPPSSETETAVGRVLEKGEHYSAIEQPYTEGALSAVTADTAVEKLLMWAKDWLNQEDDFEFIIDGWMPAQSITALLGRRGVGKTCAIVDIIMHIIFEMKWNNRDVAKDWCVLYLCGEDAAGVRNNIKAWLANHGFTESDIPEGRLVLADKIPTLTDPAEMRKWTEATIKKLEGKKVLTVLDTWQRATSRSSQSDDKEMALAVYHTEAMSRSLHGCTLAAFHPPKNREDTIHGSMIIENATAAIWTINETSGEKTVETQRVKGAKEGETFKFRMQIETTGDFDKRGKEITGVCAVRTGGGADGITKQQEEYEEKLRSGIAGVIAPVLASKKANGSVTFKEACEIVIAHVNRCARDDIISQAYYHARTDMNALLKGLKDLFPPGQLAYLDETASVQVQSNKFVLVGHSAS